MRKAVWKVPPREVFLMPFPCMADTPLEPLVYYKYNPDKYEKEKIEIIHPKLYRKDGKAKGTVFEILGWFSKYPVDKIEDIMARVVYPKKEMDGKMLVEILREKQTEFKNCTHVVFLEVARITNDRTEEKNS
nr:hypothetical protein [uncultured Draconibacterium sp.]